MSKDVVFLPLSVCPQDNSEVIDEFWWLFFWGVGCMSSNSWLNFGDELDRDADTGIFKWNFYRCGIYSAETKVVKETF